jgi:hypothetical protein
MLKENNLKIKANLLDGASFLEASPFRSLGFLISCVLCIVCLGFDGYLFYRQVHAMNKNALLALSLLIALQLIAQIWRSLNYFHEVRRLRGAGLLPPASTEPRHDLALRAALGGVADVMFWSYLTNLLLFIYIITACPK